MLNQDCSRQGKLQYKAFRPRGWMQVAIYLLHSKGKNMNGSRQRLFALFLGMTTLIGIVGCGSKDAKAVWNDGLKKCAKNDLLGPKVFYFGPSNALGPGTIFQKFADGGMQPSHLLSQYASTDLYAPAQTFSCDTTSSSSFKLSGSATLPNVIPVNGTVSGSLSTASSVTVNAQALEWDQLVTGPFKSKC